MQIWVVTVSTFIATDVSTNVWACIYKPPILDILPTKEKNVEPPEIRQWAAVKQFYSIIKNY